MVQNINLVGLLFATVLGVGLPGKAGALTLVEGKKPKAVVVVDPGPVTPAQREVVAEATNWLIDALEQASGAKLTLGDAKAGPVIVLTTATAQPELAKALKLRRDHFDAYAIQTTSDRLTLVGANVYALRHAVADVLRHLGFRYYAPSPKWHIIPSLTDIRVDINRAEVPDIATRSIWYAYGQPDKTLSANYRRWVAGNRLSGQPMLQTGHSYGNIIQRNAAEFARHPEYFALLENGERDSKNVPQARKFCFSNPDLKELVARDRINLLEENRKVNPLAFMVSVDPSDGQGTCYCEKCKALGTTTDRVFHLANYVARRIREKHPEAWVGLYAYSSHRLPPTIAVEPNVCVQVALGFNQTEFTLPELVERWAKKTSALGLREYYGVEAWDWGLPGRIRGGKVAYHLQWIPYYAARKANAFNAETNANWAGQMLGLDVAAELMWDTEADIPAYLERFFSDCFGDASPVLKDFQKRLETGGPLLAPTLSLMFDDLERANGMTTDPRVQARLVDLMAYMVYVDAFRKFQAVESSQPTRNDAYYKALQPLMTYAWQIRSRDMVHYYALARRLCNGLPLQDQRPEFYINSKDPPPVWMTGEPLTDGEIRTRFGAAAAALKTDKVHFLSFSRNFQLVRPVGTDAGPSRLLANPREDGLASFRGKLTGYLVSAEQQAAVLGIKPAKRPVTLTVFLRGDEVLHKEVAANPEAFTQIKVPLPKAGEYRFLLEGEAIVQVGPGMSLIYEASATNPAWVDYSGPHYFYVPRGTRKIHLELSGRFAFYIPGASGRTEVTPAQRVAGQTHFAVDVPEGADGKVWHTDRNTRGSFQFLNIPPFLSLNRGKIFVPREVAESDSLTTAP
jgi:hypothetical protein